MAIETIRSLKEKHQALALRGEPVVLCEDIARQLRRDGMPTAALGADRCATVLNQAAPISGERVREALQMLHDDTKSYIEVNNLGDPWHNQSMKLARDALTLPAISETRTAFREQVKSAMAILDFYEGTDEPIRDGGRPMVSIASEDFATILREFRAALPLAAQPEPDDIELITKHRLFVEPESDFWWVYQDVESSEWYAGKSIKHAVAAFVAALPERK